MTNEHIVRGGDPITISFNYINKIIKAELLHLNKTNEEPDLAVIRIKKSALTSEELNSIKPLKLLPKLPEVNDKLFVVGDPSGFAMSGLYNHGDNWLDHSGVSVKVTNPTETSYLNKDDDGREAEITSNKFIRYEGGAVLRGNIGSLIATSGKNGELQIVAVISIGDYNTLSSC